MNEHIDFSFLAKELPPLIWRYRWNALAATHGLPFRRGYMQNLDSLGIGPPKIYLRNRVAYQRTDLIAWLNHFMSDTAPNSNTIKLVDLQGWLDD